MLPISLTVNLTDPNLAKQVAAILGTVIELHSQGAHMSAELDALTAQVTANTTVIESALTLIQGLKTQIDAAGTDPAKLAELSASLASEDAKLAAAVLANTPTPPAAP